jgi:hypothetical protein
VRLLCTVEDCPHNAARVSTPEMKIMLLEMTQQYLRLAESFEKGTAHTPNPKGSVKPEPNDAAWNGSHSRDNLPTRLGENSNMLLSDYSDDFMHP